MSKFRRSRATFIATPSLTSPKMLRLILCAIVCVSCVVAMTTTVPVTTTIGHAASQILYDMKHHKAMIVRDDGCYEYHMNHQDVLDSQNDQLRPALETKMTNELASSTHVEETGHHHIDHMTQEIRTACASVPIYKF